MNIDRRRKYDAEIPAPILLRGDQPWLKLYHEFIDVSIKSKDTKKSYARATRVFLNHLETIGLEDLVDLEPSQIYDFIDHRYAVQNMKVSAQSYFYAVKAMLHFFTTQGALTVNPAASIKYPFEIDRRGKTRALSREDVVTILDSIIPKEQPEDAPPPKQTDYRDRALIATMAYGFVRIGGALSARREDYYLEDGDRWMDFTEKGAQVHTLYVEPPLTDYIDEYIRVCAIHEPDAWLFQSASKTGKLSGKPYDRNNSRKMIIKHARAAGIEIDQIGNHTFRATAITNYLDDENNSMDEAQDIANHKNIETTKRYDRGKKKRIKRLMRKVSYD